MAEIRLSVPCSREEVMRIRAGDRVLLSGTVYTARDAAHRRMLELMERGEALPFELEGAAIYYCGPAPAPPGRVIGAAGPTTSYRMDAYAPALIGRGLAVMIGKGPRKEPVREAMRGHGAVYLAAEGGAGRTARELRRGVRDHSLAGPRPRGRAQADGARYAPRRRLRRRGREPL